MLKEKMNENVLKLQHDSKLKSLEKQVEYFRSQALRLKNEREGILNNITIEFVKTIDLLKDRLDCVTQEKKFFEAFVIEARKENRGLKDHIAKNEREIMEKIKELAKQEAREASSNQMKLKHQRTQDDKYGIVSQVINGNSPDTPLVKPNVSKLFPTEAPPM